MSHINGDFEKAQIVLNQKVVEYSKPYVPFQQGALRRMVEYPEGISGTKIRWYAPYAHYQYYGDLYLDERGRSWVERYEHKPVNTHRPLVHHEPGTSSFWVERMKAFHMDHLMHDIKTEFR